MRRLILELLTQPRVSILGVLFIWGACNALWTGFLVRVSWAAREGYPWAQAFMRHAELVSWALAFVLCLCRVLTLTKEKEVKKEVEGDGEGE